ncbi:MAG TPA: thiamine diphosphokinase, partial [Holophaga sp.]|nr:thiamine diphosphokinase [Holophaga sp.]
MQRTLIIANGELRPGLAERLAGERFDGIIAVDGGAEHCKVLGLEPTLLLGDLDSVTPGTLAHFTGRGTALERHPSRKDATDLELALDRALQAGSTWIVLACALGGRLDMAVANLLLLARPAFRDVRVELWDPRQTAVILRPPGGEVHGSPGDTLSLIPLAGDAEGLATEGLAYPLRDECIPFGQ